MRSTYRKVDDIKIFKMAPLNTLIYAPANYHFIYLIEKSFSPLSYGTFFCIYTACTIRAKIIYFSLYIAYSSSISFFPPLNLLDMLIKTLELIHKN